MNNSMNDSMNMNKNIDRSMNGSVNRNERRIRNSRVRKAEGLRKYVKKQVFLAVLSFLFIFMFSFTANGFLSNAKTEGEADKYYKSIVIESGDTLWSIALQNMNFDDNDIMAYIKEVKEINGLEDDNITEGMYLIIPYF